METIDGRRDPRYTKLANELVSEISQIGHILSPGMLNSTRGEMALLHVLTQVEGPLTPKALAEQARISTARVANILRALEEKAFVSRVRSTDDRRRVEVSLTAAGADFMREFKDDRDRHLESLLAELGEKDAAELVRIVGKERQIMRRRHEEGTGFTCA